MSRPIESDYPHQPVEAPASQATILVKARRGFAAMSPEKQREIALAGAKASKAAGTAHRFTPAEARAAQRKSYVKRNGDAALLEDLSNTLQSDEEVRHKLANDLQVAKLKAAVLRREPELARYAAPSLSEPPKRFPAP